MEFGRNLESTEINPLDNRRILCYNGIMKNKKSIFRGFKPSTQPTDFRYKHLTEANAIHAGESAFKIRVPIYNNPYNENPLKSAWIRGFKRAERLFFDSVRTSQRVQASIGFEEVEA